MNGVSISGNQCSGQWSVGGGGFEEIMRKKEEAGAKKSESQNASSAILATAKGKDEGDENEMICQNRHGIFAVKSRRTY